MVNGSSTHGGSNETFWYLSLGLPWIIMTPIIIWTYLLR